MIKDLTFISLASQRRGEREWGFKKKVLKELMTASFPNC
jgi:hypothetical protein